MHKLAKEAYGEDAQRTIEQSIYAKLPTNLRKTVNQAQLEDGTYEQIVSHIEREIELNGADPGDDLAIVQLSHVKEIREEVQSDDQKRSTCCHCKKPGHHKSQCRAFKKLLNDRARTRREICETCKKPGHSAERCWAGANKANAPQDGSPHNYPLPKINKKRLKQTPQ